MTNSATSTSAQRAERGRSQIARPGDSGFHAWHFFTLLSMVGATVVVVVSRDTHPAALLLLSAAVICAGFVGLALSRAVAGFFTGGAEAPPLPPTARERLLREKALVLRSIKELEFDKAMGKVSDADYASIMAQLRARALTLMQDLEREPVQTEPVEAESTLRNVGRALRPGSNGGAKAPPYIDSATLSRATAESCGACGTAHDADARFCKSCGQPLERGN